MAESAEERQPAGSPTLTDVAEEGALEPLPLIRRRRPSGEPGPAPGRLGRVGLAWLIVGALIVLAWIGFVLRGGVPAWLEHVDAAIGRQIVRSRPDWLTTTARVIALLGSVGVIMAVRWSTIGALAFFHRGRHLVTYIVTILGLRLAVVALLPAVGRPRPAVAPYLYGWEGYSHPSAPVAMFAFAVAGSAYALAPRGRWRTLAIGIGAALTVLLALARVYLGVDHVTDVVFAGLIGWAVAVIAFALFCPEDVFPVIYRKGRAAHLEIDDRRKKVMREALEEQTGLELLSVEPFGEEGSGGSTPLKLRVRRIDGHREDTLFAKLYSATHLRADRWYKLARTILYGALEDEAAFNSVRQLVEHEDYMLRLFNEAGVSSVQPRGLVELEPEREYLIMMTMLEGAEEADQDAPVDEEVIDSGLRNIRSMWDHGLAHRDIKPANVLIHEKQVSLIDVAFGQIRPSAWRQAVDLANMMLVLALPSDPDRVYARAVELFPPDEIGEAFAAARGPAVPRQLRQKLEENDRDLIARFVELAPEREPIAIQRWSLRRIGLAVRTGVELAAVGVLLAINLVNLHAP